MSAPSKTRNFLQALEALGITAALSALLLWYYDAFAVYWQPNSYPYCVAVIILFAALLKLLQQWVRGVRGKALVWKILISLVIFPGLTLLAVSFLVNNVIYGAAKPGAHVAVAVAFPLSAAYILLQDALLFFALRKRGSRSAWILPAGILAVPLVIAAAMCLNAFYRVPQKEITPIFPEARLEQEVIPSDEEEVDDVNTIWLEAGTYTALELPSLSNVTYRSRPGEEVIVTGSVEITGWREDSVNGVDCWSVQADQYFTSLYHPDPDKQLRRPRYPAEGYLFVDHTEGAKAVFTKETAPWDLTRGHTSLFAKEGDLRQFYALEDVTLRVLHAWKDEISNLVSYDGPTNELVWQRPAAMTVNPNDRYFLENVFEELKEPGQWYLKRGGGKGPEAQPSMLYYIPFEGEVMESTVLYAGINERLLTIDGGSNVTFRGITFKNTAWNFPNSNWLDVEGMDSSQAAVNVHPCILVTNSTGINFENCKFENIGATALKFGENVHGSGVINSEFRYIGGNAVFIEGLFDAPNSNITVKNNLIAHYGRRFFNAIGVLNIHAHHVEIANNEITDGYYSAISSGWVWGYSENPTDYVAIENNLIYRIGQGWLSDMGGIYTLGMQPHSVIRGNVIHDVAADPLQGGYGGWGIYPDEGSTGQLIEKNLVYDCGSQSFHQHYGRENIVRNNIFAFSGEGQIRVSRKEEHTSIFLEGNIIVSDGQPIYTSVQKGKFIDGGNLYYDYAKPGQLFSGDDGEMGILRMRGMGYYKNALVADPLFRDAQARDFTLALNSPAVEKIGFEAWDYGQAGRQKNWPAEEPAGGILLNIDINSHRMPFLNSVADTASVETVREALRPFVAQYADTQITDVLFNIFCQYSAAPSEIFTTEAEKYLQASENGFPVDYKDYYRAPYTLSQWGVDAFEVWIAQCRELGLRPWISLRMNDCHEPDDEASFLRSDFFYEARDKGWMIGGEHGYYRNCFDYAIPEVRGKMLAYIAEQLARCDVYGLELDWMREITCFKEQGRPENIEIINGFMRDVDEIRRAAEKAWGHEIKIMCRQPRDYMQSLLYGFDAAAWAKEGLVDAVAVTPRWESNDSAMPLHQWRAALAGSDVKLYAGLEILTNRAGDDAYTTPRAAQGYAAHYLGAGADAVYLFNYFQNPNEPNEALGEIYRTCGSLDTLRGTARRHIVTFQDIAPQGVERFRPLPVKVTKAKPQSLLVHTGPVEAGSLTIYLGVSPGTNAEKLRVRLNGKPCEPLGKSELPEEANYLREPADIYAWRAAGPFPGGTQSVAIASDGAAVTVSYAEIDI